MKDIKIAGANPDIKLIACDMDGTLLDKSGSISPAARDLIRRLADYGVVFSIASGRMPHRIENHVGSFLPREQQNYIACNGAIVVYQGTVILDRRFPVKPYRNLILDYVRQGLEFSFDYDDAYRPLFASEHTIRQANHIHGYSRPIGIGDEVWELEVNKISVMDPHDSGILDGLIEGLRQIGGCSPFQYGVHASEIAPECCSKLTGVRYLAERMQLSGEQVLAIGDHINDCELLTYSGASAAVGNAVPAARECAKYQCKGEYDEGVMEAIRHYLPFLP